MTRDEILGLYHRTSFVPFDLYLAGGRKLHVVGREHLIIPDSGRTVRVYQVDLRLNIVDLMLVTDLELKPSSDDRKVRI